MKWVHLIKAQPAAPQPTLEVIATAVLEEVGTVRIDGDSPLAQHLRTNGVMTARGSATTASGEAFLAALGAKYHNASLYATPVQEGAQVLPPAQPTVRKVA